MNIYKKPYITNIYHEQTNERIYPYTKELFENYNIFPLFILDGGAYFFLKDRLGGKADAQTILDGIKSGELFNIWTEDKTFDWRTAHRLFENTQLEKQWEWMVWINRLYFLLPLAQQFFITKDEKWAEQWYTYLDQWIEDNPYQPLDNRKIYDTDLIWRDMQVGWRCWTFVHCIHLLSESSFLDQRKWARIYQSLEQHADHLYQEGLKKIEARAAHNHVLQIGTALVYIGLLFPEFKNSKNYTYAGREIVRINLEEHIYADGGSWEGSPSYSHFIARMYVDAFLLMKMNGAEGIAGLEDLIHKQYEWLYQTSSPLDRSLQVGDSYALDVKQDLEIVSKLFPLQLKKKTSIHLKESGFAVLRNNIFNIVIDAMKHTAGHQHFGRPNLLVYAHGLPLFIDCGCCNYDKHQIKSTFFKQSVAHNVVVVPEFERAFKSSKEKFMNARNASKLTISNFSANDDQSIVEIVHSYSNSEVNYVWKRSVILRDNQLRIKDRIDSQKEITCQQLFHVAPWNLELSQDNDKAVIFLKNKDITFEHTKKNVGFQVNYNPAYDDENNMSYAQTLTSTMNGTSCEFDVLLTI